MNIIEKKVKEILSSFFHIKNTNKLTFDNNKKIKCSI